MAEQYTLDEVMAALRNADAAGDVEAAQRLAAIANDMSKQQEGSYLAEAARRGFTRLPSQVYGAFKGAITGTGQTGARQYAEESQRKMIEGLGGTGARPQTTGQKILAAGVEAASDPTTYPMPSARFITAAPAVAKPALKAAEGMLTGSGAEAGGTVGEQAGGKIGGETGAQVGRVIGALAGGTATSVATGAIPRVSTTAKGLMTPAAQRVKTFFTDAAATTPQDQITEQASRQIENVFVAAAASDPNFAKVIEDAATAQASTGVKLPLSAVLADNAVINAYIQKLASQDPAFREQYFAQFQEAAATLRSKASSLFGSPAQADVTLTKNIQDVDVSGAVARRKAALDRQARQSSKGIQPVNPAEFGAKIVQVTDEAEAAARESTRPAYTKAFEIGREKGVGLSEAAVGDIYGFVAGEKSNDIFKTFPSIYGKVIAAFRPTEAVGTGLVDAAGMPIGTQTSQVFKAASLEDLDSLKREVNLQLRKTKNEAEIRLLTELKSKVNQHIESLDPAFVDAYKSADRAYLEKVGLPFNEETINMIGRAKFDENVVPLLTKNKSTLSQFLDATGDQGKTLAQQAFISDLHKKAVVDGVLDPNKARAWLKANNDALSMMPEVKDRVVKAAGDVQDLMNQRNALSDKLVKNAESRLLKLEGKSAQEIVNSMYANRDFTEKFMRTHGNNIDSLNAVRSFLLDDILSNRAPLDVLNDRSKAQVFNRVFGPTYAEKVKQLATVADRITYDPSVVTPNLRSIPKTRIEEATGAAPEMIISRITNPVMSNFYAFTSLMSKFLARKTSAATDAEMKRLLLDPKAAAAVFRNVQPRVDELNYNKMAEDVMDIARKAGLDFKQMLIEDARAGAVRSPQAMDREETAE